MSVGELDDITIRWASMQLVSSVRKEPKAMSAESYKPQLRATLTDGYRPPKYNSCCRS